MMTTEELEALEADLADIQVEPAPDSPIAIFRRFNIEARRLVTLAMYDRRHERDARTAIDYLEPAWVAIYGSVGVEQLSAHVANLRGCLSRNSRGKSLLPLHPGRK